MQYMYVIQMTFIYIVTAFLQVLISYMKRLDSICLVVLKGLGSFNGFFSFLCLVLGFLNVNLYSFFLLIKKDGLINDVKHLLKSLCLHRGPLEMYGISSKLQPQAQLFEGRLALTWGQILTYKNSSSFVQKHFPR